MNPAPRPVSVALLAALRPVALLGAAIGAAAAQAADAPGGSAPAIVPVAAGASAGAALTRPAGMLKTLKGGVSVIRQGRTLEAVAAGLVLYPGDVIRTRADGTAGITLADDTLLACGPASELVIERMAFDETTHDGNLLLSLWQGTLRVASGLIAKRRPEAVQIQTRSVVLGVRGTEFIIDARGQTP